MGITPDPRPARIGGGGIDLGRLLASWARSDGPVHVALLPPDPAQEAGEAMTISGTPFLALAQGGAVALFADRKFPAGVRKFIQASRVTESAAFVREMGGAEAALAALSTFDGPAPPLAFAGGAWEALTHTPEG